MVELDNKNSLFPETDNQTAKYDKANSSPRGFIFNVVRSKI